MKWGGCGMRSFGDRPIETVYPEFLHSGKVVIFIRMSFRFLPNLCKICMIKVSEHSVTKGGLNETTQLGA